jgi:hypothetical protein
MHSRYAILGIVKPMRLPTSDEVCLLHRQGEDAVVVVVAELAAVVRSPEARPQVLRSVDQAQWQ